MTAIVINTSFGGFGLSREAILHIAKLKGIPIFVEEGEYIDIYWKVDPTTLEGRLERSDYAAASKEAQDVHDNLFSTLTYQCDVERDDEDLIATVIFLGKKSWGDFAQLKVVNIPDDVNWVISDYDGAETIEEVHRKWN